MKVAPTSVIPCVQQSFFVFFYSSIYNKANKNSRVTQADNTPRLIDTKNEKHLHYFQTCTCGRGTLHTRGHASTFGGLRRRCIDINVCKNIRVNHNAAKLYLCDRVQRETVERRNLSAESPFKPPPPATPWMWAKPRGCESFSPLHSLPRFPSTMAAARTQIVVLKHCPIVKSVCRVSALLVWMQVKLIKLSIK